MADNVEVKAAATVPVATDVVTYSGDAGQNVQLLKAVHVTGAEGSKVVVDVAHAEDEASGDGHGGIPAMAVQKATPANTAGTDGDYEFLQMSAGRLWASSTVTAVTPGTGTGSLGKQEGEAHTAGNTGVLLLGVRNTSHTAFTGVAQGDYTPINVDAEGCLVVVGNVAHGATNADPPISCGAVAIAGVSTGTAVDAGDRTNLYAGTDGVLLVRPHCGLEGIVTGNASNTDGASFEVIAAGSAGIKHYLTQVTITNTSTAMIYCEIKDGTTVKWTIPVPAQGGATVTFAIPIPGTAATAWNCDPSAANTTTYCSMAAFKSKV